MSHEERNVLTEILANAVIIGLFMWFLVAGHTAGSFNRPDGVQLWAILVLKLIGASIVFGIVLAVTMAIVWRIVTGEGPEVMRDERDRAISGIGWKVSMLGSEIGFIGGIIALALGAEVIFALNLMLAGCAFGDTGAIWQSCTPIGGVSNPWRGSRTTSAACALTRAN